MTFFDERPSRAAKELVWPPRKEDLEGFSVVRLSEEDDADGDPVSVTIETFRAAEPEPDPRELAVTHYAVASLDPSAPPAPSRRWTGYALAALGAAASVALAAYLALGAHHQIKAGHGPVVPTAAHQTVHHG